MKDYNQVGDTTEDRLLERLLKEICEQGENGSSGKPRGIPGTGSGRAVEAVDLTLRRFGSHPQAAMGPGRRVDVSIHAIDRASLRIFAIFRKDHTKDEGLASWLGRVALEAIEYGRRTRNSGYGTGSARVIYKGIKFAFVRFDMDTPTLTSVLLLTTGEKNKERKKKRRKNREDQSPDIGDLGHWPKTRERGRRCKTY